MYLLYIYISIHIYIYLISVYVDIQYYLEYPGTPKEPCKHKFWFPQTTLRYDSGCFGFQADALNR